MRVILIFLLCSLYAFPQSDVEVVNEELDDPDESQFLEQLLASIFQRINLETADSADLDTRGYSPRAIESILDWQKQNGRKGTKKWLGKQLHGEDMELFTQDLKHDSESTQIHLRQRLQYSPSMKGWRILNKGRMRNQWGYINVLTEQDPTENQLTDHSVITLSSFSVPHFDNVILGDFHVNWGGGLILNQQGSRSSLNPKSLTRKNLFAMRPHYSSREVDYFHGVASSFSFKNVQGAAFISDRKAIGLISDNNFKEDADGIHPSGKLFEIRRAKTLGLAFETQISKIQLYGSTLLNPDVTPGIVYELGLSRELSVSQFIQVFTNSLSLRDCRLLFTWTYSTKPLILAVQYRRYRSGTETSSGSVFTLLGSSASNEEGLSIRAQIRPGKKIQIRYALETGKSVKLISYDNFRVIQHHKIQLIMKLPHGRCQFDFSRKKEHPIMVGDVWDAQFAQAEISKGAAALLHQFTPGFKYRINLKSAYAGKESALLVQQRISSDRGKWKWTLGYVRYMVPDYTLRMSVYETSVAESFSFFTCYDDGDRWFLYLKHQALQWIDLELKLVQTRSVDKLTASKQLGLSFQMSVVL